MAPQRPGNVPRTGSERTSDERLSQIIMLERRSIRDARFHFWVLVVLMVAVLAIALASLIVSVP